MGKTREAAFLFSTSARQTPFVPADAGTQALPQKLGSRIRGNERMDRLHKTITPLLSQPDNTPQS
jgi:hypothetical protein